MASANMRIAEALALSALLHVLIFAPLQQPGGGARMPAAWKPLLVTIGQPDAVTAVAAAPESLKPETGPAASGVNVPTRGPERETIDATRPARPEELIVNVILPAEDGSSGPQNALDIGGQRYVYFNSPGVERHARPVTALQPRYPAARPANPDGSVVLELLIDEQGLLEQVNVICAAPGFEASARESVAGLRFSPALGPHGPVKSFMLVEFAYGRSVPCDSGFN